MNKKNWSNIMSVLARTALTFVVIFGQGAWGGQNQSPQNKSDANGKAHSWQAQATASLVAPPNVRPVEEEEAATQSNAANGHSGVGGPKEGIKVHGHWTIEVRDGTNGLILHREFENSIQQGALALAGILGRQNSSGFWGINLFVSSNCNTPGASAANPVCSIFEPISNLSATPSRSNNLVLAVTNNGASLTLSGSIAAPVPLQITSVQTVLSLCPATTSSTACATGVGVSGNAFTSTNLTTPISVQGGQIVQATVVISFS